jgi:hypothetical protein
MTDVNQDLEVFPNHDPFLLYRARTRGAAGYFGAQRHQVERPLMRSSEGSKLYVADLLAARRNGVRPVSNDVRLT